MPTSYARGSAVIIAIGLLVVGVLLSVLFVNRDIQIDEGWIGQQAWRLAHDGVVTTELFRDYPPLDREIVVYHKLLVWTASGVISIFGWGLYQLRAISLLAGIVALLLLGSRTLSGDRSVGFLAVGVMMCVPLTWIQMTEFRPEMLMVMLGMTSLVLLHRARAHRGWLLALCAGLCAGLAGLTHAMGMCYAVAGVVALCLERRWKFALIFGIASTAAFLPYLSAWITNTDAFLAQTVNNTVSATRIVDGQYHPLLNLLNEHKRLWRRAESIGISTLMVLAMCLINRAFWRRHRFDFMYTFALFVVIGASPLDKNPRYMIPLVPLFALMVARVWQVRHELAQGLRGSVGRIALMVWGMLFVGYGVYAVAVQVARPPRHIVATNAMLASQIEPGTIVMAPFDFVFRQQGRFVIQSWDGMRDAARIDTSVAALERRCDSVGVQYIIVDSLATHTWRLGETGIERNFSRYKPVIAIPEKHRWLLRR